MIRSLSGGGVFLDIGANIGFMSMALKSIASRIVAFEPQPEVYNVMVENIKNASGNAEFSVLCCGVSNKTGTAQMPRIRYGDRGNYGGLGFGRSELGSYSVPLVTIDGLEFPSVDLVKIDVEGHELQVLEGMVDTISRCRPVMYIEDDRPEKSKALREFIIRNGYTIEEHNPPMYREDNFKGLMKNIWDRNYVSKNIICRPC
jgi:FkbM family methyltransferase